MAVPRTLIIGQPFNNDFGGGITQANLFGGWDKDKIAVVCTDHMFNNLNTDICDTYYILGKEEYKWAFPFNLLQRSVESGPRKVKPAIKNNNPSSAGTSKFRAKLIDKYFYPFLEYIGLFHGISRLSISDKLKKWIDEYKPDVIYAQAPTRELVVFVAAMQTYIKKPMLYHVMDDWPSTISQKGPFKNYWHKKIDRELRILLDRSKVLMSISHAMAEEYKRRYGRDFVTFHNPIEINFWKSHQRNSYTLSTAPAILYAGRIGPGINITLETLARAIDKMNSQYNRNVQFFLQTKDKPEWVNNYKCVQHKSLVPYGDLPRVFAEADFLYLPYDFTIDSIRYIKYSMPTKAPEYMVSGTPVIVFGPAETALVMDAQRNNWAAVVTENNIDLLAETINKLVSDENMRKQITANAVRIAETNYDSVKVRNRFREVITAAAS
jgi:glycosyltransferase involved in cell wall biosynthesis